MSSGFSPSPAPPPIVPRIPEIDLIRVIGSLVKDLIYLMLVL